MLYKKTHKMKHSFFLPLLLTLIMQQVCVACSSDKDENKSTTTLNWADKTLWYDGNNRLNNINPSQPDIIYFLPTCLTAWTDETGTIHYNADPTRADHLEAWKLSAELADTIFATRANLFLPYYRQAVFEGLEGEHAAEAWQTATLDATESFDYYLKHYNNGRQFILAGYSQGGQMVKEVLKHMDDDAYHRLIAAYVVGYGITPTDTMTQPDHKSSHIVLAKDSASCGVTVNFNSVTTTDAISSLLCRDNIGCINPVSWTTSATPATLLEAGQTGKADDARFPYATAVAAANPSTPVTVSVDPQNHVLIVNGINAQRYHLSALDSFFKVGNLHLQELFFYEDFLRHNVLLRSNNKQKSTVKTAMKNQIGKHR